MKRSEFTDEHAAYDYTNTLEDPDACAVWYDVDAVTGEGVWIVEEDGDKPMSRREEFLTWCWALLTLSLRRTKGEGFTIISCHNWRGEVVVLRILNREGEDG